MPLFGSNIGINSSCLSYELNVILLMKLNDTLNSKWCVLAMELKLDQVQVKTLAHTCNFDPVFRWKDYVWNKKFNKKIHLKLRCDTRFQRAFTACVCVFKVITLVWANQRNYFENATVCSICTLKTRVATQLYVAQRVQECFEFKLLVTFLRHLGKKAEKSFL